MNGRVQDAITGRFLSPDPHTSRPGNTQSYNRYSYVANNPLTFVDPSGFDIETVTTTASRDTGGSFSGSQPGLGYAAASGNQNGHLPVWLEQSIEEVQVWAARINDIAAFFSANAAPALAGNEGSKERTLDVIEEVVVEAKGKSTTCTRSGSPGAAFAGSRTPDYLVVTIPTLPGVGLSATIDREGNVYIGPTIGVNFLSRSGRAAGVGWTGHSQVPSNEQLQDWLSGSSANLGVGGVGFTWSSPQGSNRLDPERFGANLQVSGAAVGWNFHIADVDLTICY